MQNQNYINKSADLFKNKHNCAQAIAVAFCDRTNLSIEQAKESTVGFEAGKKEFCGAILGSILIAENAGVDIVYFLDSINKAFNQKAGSVYCKTIKANKFSCADCVSLAASVLTDALDNAAVAIVKEI